MWVYSQSSGQLWSPSGWIVGIGYSGHGEGKNSPKLEAIRSVGPIPRGMWSIGDPYDSKRIGPYALPLLENGHYAMSRTYFRVHGDSVSDPGNASNGCVIFSRSLREKIHVSKDRDFLVIE